MIIRSIGGLSDIALKALEKSFGQNFLYAWGGFNHHQEWAYTCYAKAIKERKKIICVETPLIGRDMYNEGRLDSYLRIGVNSVSSQNYLNFNLPKYANSNRLDSVLLKVGKKLKPWRTAGDHILYAMQIPADSSLRGLDIFAAAQYDLIEIRQITDRPIIITLHPDLNKTWGINNLINNSQYFNAFKKVVSLVGGSLQIGGSKDALRNCWCTVCHTSGFGFESITEGIPVITLSRTNFIAPICSQSLYDIEDPYIPTNEIKTSWLNILSYCQWNIEEIESGEVLEHLSPILY